MLQVAYARHRMGKVQRRLRPEGAARRLLIILLDHLGDVAQSLPLIHSIQRQLPSDQLTLVTDSRLVDLFTGAQGGASSLRVLGLPGKGAGKLRRWLWLPAERYHFARRHLWKEGFDVCLVPRVDADYQCAVLLGYFSGAPVRISFSEKATYVKRWQNRHYDRLLTVAVPGGGGHEAKQLRALITTLAPQATVPKVENIPLSDTAWAVERLPGGRRWVALCPSQGTSVLKQWGVHRWADVAVDLCRRGFSLVLVGGREDAESAHHIESRTSGECINLAGATTLGQLASVLGRCELFLGNDCGPMQLASAMNCPTVAVMGSTCVHRFGAWAERSLNLKVELPCSPCRTHRSDRCSVCIYERPKCMEQITVDDVLKAALSLLGLRAGAAIEPPVGKRPSPGQSE